MDVVRGGLPGFLGARRLVAHLVARVTLEERARRLEDALREVAKVSDDVMRHGRPVTPVMASIHRLAVSTLDDLLAADQAADDETDIDRLCAEHAGRTLEEARRGNAA